MSDEHEKPARMPPRWFVRLAWSTHRGLYRVTGGRVGLRRAKVNRYGMMRKAFWMSGQGPDCRRLTGIGPSVPWKSSRMSRSRSDFLK